MKIFTILRYSCLSVIFAIIVSCGDKNKSTEMANNNLGPEQSFQDQVYKNETDISAQDWDEINVDLAPQMGVQIGMNFFSLSRNIDILSISSDSPRPKPTYANGPEAPSITSKSSIKEELLYFIDEYAKQSFWNLLKDKNICQTYAIELIRPDHQDFEKFNQQYYVLEDVTQIIYMTIPNYLSFRSEIEYIYSDAGRFLDDVTTEFDYYSTSARSFDIRGLYWLEKSSTKASEMYENWLEGIDPQGDFENAIYLMCRQFLADPDPETAFDCRDKIKNKTLDSSEFITLLQFSRLMKSAMFYISTKNHLPASEFEVVNLDNHTLLTVYAQRPTDAKIASFIKESVEKYWKTEKYQINLAWADENNREALIHIKLTEEGTSWASFKTRSMNLSKPGFRYDDKTATTIAHEFGHLLGFTDCYVEFYDDDKNAMVEYKSDVNNLMCTNAGWVQDQHFEEFFRVH